MRNKLPPQDQQARFHNTILMYQGVPVAVTLIDGNTFSICGLHEGSPIKRKDIKCNDPNLDISTPPLGWMNIEVEKTEYAMYVVRQGLRKWQQGISGSNTKGYLLYRNALAPKNTRDYLYSKAYDNAVRNIFLPLDICIKKIKTKNCESIAVSRDICLSKHGDLVTVYYKMDEVAMFSPEDMVVRVPKEENSWIVSKYLNSLSWKVD